MKRVVMFLLALPLLAVAAEPKVVALGGDVTEIVYGLGAQNQLVGRDSTSTWPAEVKQLPNVGYVRQLNAEGILSLRPTIVLAGSQAQPSLVLKSVQDNDVYMVPVPGGYTLSEIDKKVVVIARALGKNEESLALRKKLATEIAALPTSPLDKKVLYILSHGGMGTLVAGRETAADGAIQAAGLNNAMQGFSHYRAMSQEGVIASQPDLVLISAEGVKHLGGEENIWYLPGLAQTPAGRNKQLLIVDEAALLGFGLRTPQALLELRKKAEQLP